VSNPTLTPAADGAERRIGRFHPRAERAVDPPVGHGTPLAGNRERVIDELGRAEVAQRGARLR